MSAPVQQATIRQYAKQLRLATVGGQFVQVAEQAIRQKQSHLSYLEALLGAEVEEREILKTLGIPKCGFHAFRRFRNTFLRNSLCPDGLLKFWMGHAAKDMSDRYDRVREDVQFRRDAARSLGVGFEVPKALSPKRAKPERPKVGEVISGVIGRQPEIQLELSC
jgi:hypothetical protein